MDLAEIWESPAFWILTGVGAAAVSWMIIMFRWQDTPIPLWIKIAAYVAVPIIAALFSGFAEG